MKLNMVLAFLAFGAAMTLPDAARAHPTLVEGSPAANVAAAKPTFVKLTFSERLMPKLSGATLIMTGMPGMANHPDMKMPGIATRIATDGKSIMLTSSTPLPAGTYRVDWAVVGADTHRVTGAHSFAVK
jgi:methionine-rich copper-binding protein CopC